MALKALNNPLDFFLHDQNQKLLANPFFMSERGDFYADVWHFANGKKITSVDFSVFDLPIFKLESPAILRKSEEVYTLSSKEYAKLFCSVVLTPKTTQALLPSYQMVMQIFAYLNECHEAELTISVLDDFWISFMSRLVNQNGFFNRVSVPSYRGSIRPVSLTKLRNQLKSLGVEGVIEKTLTLKKIEKSLDKVCQSSHCMTLSEFKKGASFNFLGLELGQHYVDYLNQVYQNNFLYTATVKTTVSTVMGKVGMANITDIKSRNRLFYVILSGILGNDLDKPRAKTRGVDHLELKVLTEQTLIREYDKHFDSVCSLRDSNIELLVAELGLGARFDAVEVIRVLMLQRFWGLNGHKTPEDIWSGYLSSLDKSFKDIQSLKVVSIDEVYAKMQSIVNKQRLTGGTCLEAIQQWAMGLMEMSTYRTYESFKALLEVQLHAMTTLVVAWTGYRKSEYGFPLSAIRTEPNLDILDSAHVPFRFKLKWFVPKTNGSTKIDRELISQCYQVAAQLDRLFECEHDEPCLYSVTDVNKNKKRLYQSERYLETRVKSNWEGFVNNYQPYNEVLRLNDLRLKEGELTYFEQKEVDTLSLKYSFGSARYRQLLSSAREVKTDWLRLSHTSFVGNKAQIELKQSLVNYSHRDPVRNDEHQTIIDNYLSNETKELLQSGKVNLVDDKKTMRDITTEILEGVRYPTPHGLRHVWAEAVLTRYQGDVGAVIRHQFCHLDGSFFMEYLRDKDARGLMVSAKQRYLNSIVEMLIVESEHVDQKHSGGFSRFVQKASQLTQVKTESELLALREKIAGRVIDIQPSRFAVCIPRDGVDSRAKCSKMGSLNPQDAKPEFCLDCVNAWITEGNIRGIWQTIQPMVKEAMQPQGIGLLLESHLPALTSSWRRIKELRNARNRESVDKILAAIEEAVDSIKEKMNVEAERYGYE
ncbi:hypothetical protein [Vibrio astriarenae]|uniref:hypothetical protein n=1 Tax=Vibrio astriarenae TaxID=1481923 RepID=UPI003735A815